MARKTLTTKQGVPGTNNPNSLTAAQRSPAFLQDVRQIEKQEMML